jgi:hypothetical protein
MGKGIIRKIIFPLCLLLPMCTGAQLMHSQANTFFTAKADKSIEIFVFDGFKLSPIFRDTEVIKQKIPVTEGNYFVIFFVKDGYIPAVKTLQAGKGDIRLGEIRLTERITDEKGFLTGVVYKTIHGGKISYKKGILKLFGKVIIKVVGETGETYLTESTEGGVFSIPLPSGKYKIFIDNKEEINIIIKKGKTTIQNLQRGVMLIE